MVGRHKLFLDQTVSFHFGLQQQRSSCGPLHGESSSANHLPAALFKLYLSVSVRWHRLLLSTNSAASSLNSKLSNFTGTLCSFSGVWRWENRGQGLDFSLHTPSATFCEHNRHSLWHAVVLTVRFIVSCKLATSRSNELGESTSFMTPNERRLLLCCRFHTVLQVNCVNSRKRWGWG